MTPDWLGLADMERKRIRELGRASDSRNLRAREASTTELAPPKTLLGSAHPHLCPCGNVWQHTPAPEFGRCLYAGSTAPCPTCFDKENP